MTITASSDDSRSNGDEYQNGEGNNYLPEDGESCTGKTMENVLGCHEIFCVCFNFKITTNFQQYMLHYYL